MQPVSFKYVDSFTREKNGLNQHIVDISSDGEGEATMDKSILGIWVRISQVAARQHSFLSGIESNFAKLFPVTNCGIFHHEFVNCQFSLPQ